MSVLINHGWFVNSTNNDGDTALHLASRHGNSKVVQRLAEAFPDEQIKNRRGLTALDEASQADQTQCANYIRKFVNHGKAEVLEEHRNTEICRLQKRRRNAVRRFLQEEGQLSEQRQISCPVSMKS